MWWDEVLHKKTTLKANMAQTIEIILNLAWIKFMSNFLPMQTQMKYVSYINSNVSCLHKLSKNKIKINYLNKHQNTCKRKRWRCKGKKVWSCKWHKDMKKVCSIEEKVHWKPMTLEPIILEWMPWIFSKQQPMVFWRIVCAIIPILSFAVTHL